MYPTPTGSQPDVEQCRALDDDLFRSDPNRYFRSKIDALLDWSEQSGTGVTAERARFMTVLGQVASAHHPTSQDQRRLQIALDAVQVRFQAAEALIRLVDACLERRSRGGTGSLWLDLARSSVGLPGVIDRIVAHQKNDQFPSVWAGLLFPVPAGTEISEEMIVVLRSAWEWFRRAADIVSGGPLHLAGANNKIKHGIAVRHESHAKLTLLPEAPNEDGTVNLSALQDPKSVDLFTVPYLDYISQPPKESGQERAGYERTWLGVDTPVVLAEAWMLAMVHGAVFATAAYRHFGEDLPEGAPGHPGVVAGPTPRQVLGGDRQVVGMRFPVTTSDSGAIHRPTGVMFTGGAFITMTFGPATHGTVVDG